MPTSDAIHAHDRYYRVRVVTMRRKSTRNGAGGNENRTIKRLYTAHRAQIIRNKRSITQGRHKRSLWYRRHSSWLFAVVYQGVRTRIKRQNGRAELANETEKKDHRQSFGLRLSNEQQRERNARREETICTIGSKRVVSLSLCLDQDLKQLLRTVLWLKHFFSTRRLPRQYLQKSHKIQTTYFIIHKNR